MGGTQIQAHEAVSRCIAVLDVGTTAVKACLFSPSLELLACSVQEYALRTQGERVEADGPGLPTRCPRRPAVFPQP